MDAATATIRYQVTGMDCASCAAKIEGAARKVEGVDDVKVSIASQIMTLMVDDPARRLPALESAVTGLGYQLDRMSEPKVAGAEADEDDDKIPDLSHVTPAYKRALWIVVLLNIGYGVVEIVGSFLAGSQALQADALDFVGDGFDGVLVHIDGDDALFQLRQALAQRSAETSQSDDQNRFYVVHESTLFPAPGSLEEP